MRTWIAVVNPFNGSGRLALCRKFPTLRETFKCAYTQLALRFKFDFAYDESHFVYNGHDYKINKNLNPYRFKL